MTDILVVDDEEGIRAFLVDALGGEGHDVFQAADGQAALEQLNARNFDLLITDLRMPGTLDGVGLLRKAKTRQPDLEVILLTAHGTVETAVEAMKLGAFDYLEKPIASLRELRILVWRALERRRRTAFRDLVAADPPTTLQSGDPIAQLSGDVARALGTGYAVEEMVGRGGYAVVFQVHDRRLDRKLAAKVLYPEFSANARVAEQFRREARMAARLNHPNIVPVYFVGTEGQVPCLVMPLVEGESLASRLTREGALGVSLVVRIVRDIAAALDYAHQAGVIHRDVKPENILLEANSGRCLLTDFGIAKAIAADVPVTGPWSVVGTPQYVSPEQAAGDQTLGAATDIYSFGIVVYEMLAGTPPFEGRHADAVFAQHMNAPVPPLRSRRPGLTGEAEAVVGKALAKDPAARYTRAGEFARALEEACGRPMPWWSSGAVSKRQSIRSDSGESSAWR